MTQDRMIILGYVSFALWMPLMFLVGELLGKKTKLDKEVIRKIQHILTSVAWFLGAVFFGPTIHIVIINFLGFIALTIATFSNKLNFTSRSDSKRSYGLMYFGLGTLIVITLGVYVVPELFYQTAIPYYCLALADGLAPLIAKLFKNKNIKITNNKTLVGSLSILLISFLVIFIANSILKTNFDVWFMIGLASLCTVLELYGEKGLDNLLIELGMFGLLILNHFNLTTTPILISLITAPIILIFALIKKSITLPAAIMGLIMSLSISFFIGESVLLVILGLFLIAEFVSKVVRKIMGNKEKHPRGFRQIFSITIISIITGIIYYLTNDKTFLYISYLSIIGQFADSMASDIGSLSKKNPVDIFRGKEVEKGISGGVTLLGTSASLITSILGALIVMIFEGLIFDVLIIIVLTSFLGTIIDSILGSLLQAKYTCLECGKETDSKICCDTQTKHKSGLKFIDNTTVNLLSSILTAVISLILFWVI